MYITKQEVEKILAVMTEFEVWTVRSYRLDMDNSSGIGSVLNLTIDMDIMNRPAEVKIEISGVESW